VPHSGQLAVDCVAADATDPYMSEIQQLITTEHLLQFGALLGESSAELALSQSGAAGAVGPGPDSLLGHVDNWSSWGNGWESVCTEACTKRGVHYWAWRRYLRNGLFMYKSRTGERRQEGTLPAQHSLMGGGITSLRPAAVPWLHGIQIDLCYPTSPPPCSL
jgi:hypothetical protein